MSRGLGKMERVVAARVARCKRRDERQDERFRMMGQPPPEQHVLVSSWDVAVATNPAYPEPFVAPTRSQLNSAVRAMHSFVCKFPEYALISGQGRGRLHLYERGDETSAMWARLKSQHCG